MLTWFTKKRLNARLASYNRAAARYPWFVLRDLDHDAPCAPELVVRLLPQPSVWMCFRVAVRQAESWLLADREAIASYLSVAASRVPVAPDSLDDPKRALVSLAATSKRRAIREAMVPEKGKSAPVGPGYLTCVTEFASAHWHPKRTASWSPSLRTALAALERLGDAGPPDEP